MGEIRTLLDIFAAWRETLPEPALVDARGGATAATSASQVTRQVAGLAKGLADLGIRAGDRVALLSANRPEWHIVDFAVQHLGAADVPIYTTLLAAQVAAILADSGARAVVVDNRDQLAKVLEVRPRCPALEHVLLIDGPAPPDVTLLADCTVAMSAEEAATFLEACRPRVTPADLATIIYTSGTTGEPKGAMLTHDNFVFNAISASAAVPWPEEKDVALSFLPISHVLERLVDYVDFLKGSTMAYCGVLEVAESFRLVRPTIFTAVPRVYEKIYDRIFQEVASAPKIRQLVFRTAIRVATEALRTGRKGLAWHVLDRLACAKVRAAFGGRLRFSISGGAPLAVYVGEFLHAVGIRVLEGYGLTETSPVIAANTYDRPKLGTVGPAIAGVEIRIADDGEILTRGRHVMKGYWNSPAATAAMIDGEGWLATGDIGELDADGYLHITDRKKDILVTAGGKNIAPQPIENQLKASPLVENAVLFGDRRPYIVALIVPNFEELERWARQHGLPVEQRVGLVTAPEVVQLYHDIVDGVDASLARFETIKKFRLLAQPLTMDSGELTPTLKVKRRQIENRYGHLIDAMYTEPGA